MLKAPIPSYLRWIVTRRSEAVDGPRDPPRAPSKSSRGEAQKSQKCKIANRGRWSARIPSVLHVILTRRSESIVKLKPKWPCRRLTRGQGDFLPPTLAAEVPGGPTRASPGNKTTRHREAGSKPNLDLTRRGPLARRINEDGGRMR